MNEIIQWIIVAMAVALSAFVLYKRIHRSAKGKCDGCCSNCSKAAKELEECAERKGNKQM